MTNAAHPVVTIEELQGLLSDDAAFAKALGFVVPRIGRGSSTFAIPPLPRFERPRGIGSGQVLTTAADGAIWLARHAPCEPGRA